MTSNATADQTNMIPISSRKQMLSIVGEDSMVNSDMSADKAARRLSNVYATMCDRDAATSTAIASLNEEVDTTTPWSVVFEVKASHDQVVCSNVRTPRRRFLI